MVPNRRMRPNSIKILLTWPLILALATEFSLRILDGLSNLLDLSKESFAWVHGRIFTRGLQRIFTWVLRRTFTWVSVSALGRPEITQCSAINCVCTLIQCALLQFFVTLEWVTVIQDIASWASGGAHNAQLFNCICSLVWLVRTCFGNTRSVLGMLWW